MRIAVGADDAGTPLADTLTAYLRSQGIDIDQFTAVGDESYPDVAFAVASKIADGTYGLAILACGTGIGMSIAANKVPGVSAALCHDVYSAERARRSNNAQVLTMGARVIGIELAKMIVDKWLGSDFVDGPSTRKLRRLAELEREVRNDLPHPE